MKIKNLPDLDENRPDLFMKICLILMNLGLILMKICLILLIAMTIEHAHHLSAPAMCQLRNSRRGSDNHKSLNKCAKNQKNLLSFLLLCFYNDDQISFIFCPWITYLMVVGTAKYSWCREKLQHLQRSEKFYCFFLQTFFISTLAPCEMRVHL